MGKGRRWDIPCVPIRNNLVREKYLDQRQRSGGFLIHVEEDGKNLVVIKIFLRISVISGKFFCLQTGLDPSEPQGCFCGNF